MAALPMLEKLKMPNYSKTQFITVSLHFCNALLAEVAVKSVNNKT